MDSDVTQSTAFYNFLGWLEVNKKRLLVSGGVIAAIAAVTAIYIYSQVQKEEKASRALSEVRAGTGPSAPPPQDLAAAYFKVAGDYPGTKAAERAWLQGAGSLFVAGKHADAQKQFEAFLKQSPNSPWVPQALFGVASSLDAQKMPAEALRAYEDLRKRFGSDPVMDQAKLALARLYESQNPKEALALYDDLLKANQYGGIGSEAGMRREDLLQKHPDLAPKTNAPALTPPMMSSNPSIKIGTNKTITVSNLPSLKPAAPAPSPAATQPKPTAPPAKP